MSAHQQGAVIRNDPNHYVKHIFIGAKNGYY